MNVLSPKIISNIIPSTTMTTETKTKHNKTNKQVEKATLLQETGEATKEIWSSLNIMYV